MEGSREAKRQREQLDRYLKWVNEEGGVGRVRVRRVDIDLCGNQEGPTHLDTWFKPHQQNRLRWLKKHCVGTVMELGCNYGYVLAYCGGQVGVDWSQKSIELARILNPRKEFVIADIRNLPLPDMYVDTVMASDVLEHIPWEDIPQALKQAKRVARHKILVTIPDGETDSADAICFKHRWLATPERVQAIAKEFTNEKVTIERKGGFILMEVIK